MSASEPQLPTFDLYRELEVHPDASPETIEAAWRSLAKRNHPDANPTIGIDRIRRMNIAHDWLSDPALRARYDSMRKQHRKRTPPKASSTGPLAPAPRSIPTPSSAAGVSLGRIAAYGVLCLVSVVIAYIISVVAAVLLGAANVTVIAAAFLGDDGAVTLIQLVGNLLFAGALGYLVAACFASTFEDRSADADATLVIVGAIAALAMTFGFPAFAASYLTGLLGWMVTDGAGLPAVAVLSAAEAAFVGFVVAGTAWVRRAS